MRSGKIVALGVLLVAAMVAHADGSEGGAEAWCVGARQQASSACAIHGLDSKACAVMSAMYAHGCGQASQEGLGEAAAQSAKAGKKLTDTISQLVSSEVKKECKHGRAKTQSRKKQSKTLKMASKQCPQKLILELHNRCAQGKLTSDTKRLTLTTPQLQNELQTRTCYKPHLTNATRTCVKPGKHPGKLLCNDGTLSKWRTPPSDLMAGVQVMIRILATIVFAVCPLNSDPPAWKTGPIGTAADCCVDSNAVSSSGCGHGTHNPSQCKKWDAIIKKKKSRALLKEGQQEGWGRRRKKKKSLLSRGFSALNKAKKAGKKALRKVKGLAKNARKKALNKAKKVAKKAKGIVKKAAKKAKGFAMKAAKMGGNAAVKGALKLLTKMMPTELAVIATKLVNTFMEGGNMKEMIAKLSRDKAAAQPVSRILTRIRNWILLHKASINPCTWECICKRMVTPLMDFDYTTRVYMPVAWKGEERWKKYDSVSEIPEPLFRFTPAQYNELYYGDPKERPGRTARTKGNHIGFIKEKLGPRESDDDTKPQAKFAVNGQKLTEKEWRAKRRSLFMDDDMLSKLQKLKVETFSPLLHARKIVVRRYKKKDGGLKGALLCEMMISYFSVTCNTCCCKHGMMNQMIKTELTVNNPKKLRGGAGGRGGVIPCGNWFSLMDTLSRAYLSAMRMLNSVQLLGGCTQ